MTAIESRSAVLAFLLVHAIACRAPARDTPDATSPPPSTLPAPPVELSPRSLERDLPADAAEADRVRLGARIFADTPRYAAPYVGNDLSCESCHLGAGQKVGALPLNGAAAMYPAFQKRANRAMTIEERVTACFERSENGKPPPPGSAVLEGVTAYVTWLASGWARGANPPWRGRNTIAEFAQIAMSDVDVTEGARLYGERCASCHGADGRGQARPIDAGDATAIPSPLWGPRSFNDGAGLARVYTLAGFVRWAMPLGAGGTLTDKQALAIAGYVDSKERPPFAPKTTDYPNGGPPQDAVYYESRYTHNPLRK